MQRTNEPRIGRRPVLKGAGAALGALGGLASPVSARKGKGRDAGGKGKGRGAGGHLNDTPAEFILYWSGVNDHKDNPDETDHFGFPLLSSPDSPVNLNPDPAGDWFLVGRDPGGGEGLFDGSEIKITPNHQTLHHSLRFFGGFLMKGRAKPYTLVNQGNGVFESKGQTANFESRSSAEIQARLEAAFAQQMTPKEAAKLAGYLANSAPLGLLADRKLRAVANEQLKVVLEGEGPYDSEWAATRVDFYSRGKGKPTYILSLLYTLWQAGNIPAAGKVIPPATSLIEEGRLNLGGQ